MDGRSSISIGESVESVVVEEVGVKVDADAVEAVDAEEGDDMMENGSEMRAEMILLQQ